MLSQPQRSKFERDGYCVVEQAFTREAADAMKETLFSFAEKELGIEQSRPEGWKTVGSSNFDPLTRSGGFRASRSRIVDECLDDLLGCDNWFRGRAVHPLVTLPAGVPRWLLPTKGWHSDYPVDDCLRRVRIFAYLVDVEPGGGGTLVVAGSHRVSPRFLEMNPGTSANSGRIKKELGARFHWFADLMSGDREDEERTRRLMHESAEVLGVPVHVAELAQRAGDVVLWHPNLLHAASPNVRSTPRVMLVSSALQGSRAR